VAGMIIKVTTLNSNQKITFCALCDFGLGAWNSKKKVNFIYSWTVRQFGPPKKNSRWINDNNKFYFQNEQDLNLFLLRWA
jgi:hypothetical protein